METNQPSQELNAEDYGRRAEATISAMISRLGEKCESNNVDEMSANDLLELSERVYASNIQKQEEVFERVLKSMEPVLANESGSDTAAGVRRDPNFQLVQSVFNESKRSREQREIDRVLRKQELLEQKELSIQREQLRQRHLLEPNAPSSEESSNYERNHIQDEIDEIDLGALENFSIVDVLSSDPFNQLLAQVENDLADVSYVESEELSEVFAILDAAKQSKQKAGSRPAEEQPASKTLVNSTARTANNLPSTPSRSTVPETPGSHAQASFNNQEMPATANEERAKETSPLNIPEEQLDEPPQQDTTCENSEIEDSAFSHSNTSNDEELRRHGIEEELRPTEEASACVGSGSLLTGRAARVPGSSKGKGPIQGSKK